MSNSSNTALVLRTVIASWEEPNTEALSDKDRRIYEKRKRAIDLIAYEGYSYTRAAKEGDVCRAQITNLIERCLTLDSSGVFFGYFALVPYIHVKSYVYPENSIEHIMNENPDILIAIKKKYFKRSTTAHTVPMKIEAFRLFQQKLVDKGFTNNDYPRCLSDKGLRSFYRYLDRIELSDMALTMSRKSDNAKQRNKTTGGNPKAKPKVIRPYSTIQIDAHDLDFYWATETKDIRGNIIYKSAGRPKLYMALDVATGVVVGYVLCYEFDTNRGTALKLFETIIKPIDPCDDIEKAWHPSAVFEEARWAKPEVIMLDNHSVQLSADVMSCIERLGVILQYGPVSSPVYRSRLERAFGSIETMAGHKLPSTTGSNPSDIKRVDPERAAEEYGITREFVDAYIALAIAEYNNSPSSALDGDSPYQAMGAAFNAGLVPNKIDKSRRDETFAIYRYEIRKICSNRKSGARPHINIFSEEYSGPIIASSYEYTGMEVVCEINPEDVSEMKIYTKKGQLIDTLHAKGKHEGMRLSERTKKELNKHAREMYVERNAGLTITDEKVEELENSKRKKDRKLASAIKHDTKGQSLPKAPKKDPVVPAIMLEREEARRYEEKMQSFVKAREKKTAVSYKNITNAEDLFRAAFGNEYFEKEGGKQ